MCERLQVRDCHASEMQEREEVTAAQSHSEHFSSSSPRLTFATKASQASAKIILLGGISHSYQENILVLWKLPPEVKLVTTVLKNSSLTLLSLFAAKSQARKMMNA